jgi:hypothetical protein
MVPATLVAVFLVGVPATWAQTITGTIGGTVTDSAGAMVVGARVTATNQSTGVQSATITPRTGTYTIQFLPIGAYTITAGHTPSPERQWFGRNSQLHMGKIDDE